MPDDRWRQRRERLLTAHVFDKVRALDLSLAEFDVLLDGGEIVEELRLRPMELKQVRLILGWVRALHVVVVIDDVRHEERIVTVYEPHADRWSRDFRERRRR